MIKSSKTLLLIACALSLSACLKVENKSNQKVADALTEQTKVLEEQKTSISLGGIVKNLSTDSRALNATVTVKIGSTLRAPVALDNGVFLLENLPADSDYELTFHSTLGAFVNRTQFGKTRATTAPGSVYQDLGIINVAAGVERRLSILDANTSLPISNLVLRANSNIGSGANFEQYLHTASYDATTQQYKITLPERMGIDVYANLDVNNDGKTDFLSESDDYGTEATLVIDSTHVDNPVPIYLSDLNVDGKVKIRISLLDSTLKPILNAKPILSDAINGLLTATYDATTEQYVFDAIIVNDINVMIPAITVGSIAYLSSTLHISRVPESIGLHYLLYNSQNYAAPVSFAKGEEKIFNVVQQPAINLNSNVAMTAKSEVVDSLTQGFKVFYSSAIDIAEGSASLVKKNVLHIVRGNESASDSTLAGITLVEAIDEPVATDTQLSLGNTLLTVTPTAPLASGYSYKYNIGTIADSVLKISFDLNNDMLDFDIKSSAVFNMGEIKLDNNNYFNQGSVIHPANTAGAAPSLILQASSVYVFFPLSLNTLKNLVLRKELVTENNIGSNDFQDYVVVHNGQINNVSLVTAVSVASNEGLAGSLANSIFRGTTLADGGWYALSLGEYMNDNVPNINSVSFSYSLETMAGVKTEGTLALSVF